MRGLNAQTLLAAYAAGVFPMAESKHDLYLHWIDPERRGVLPLERFHVSRSLAKLLKRQVFEIRIDSDFQAVIDGCADSRPGREDSWINPIIRSLFLDLHAMNLAHSVEVWQNERLVGGLYGLALGGAFFGESMFSKVTNASKAALAHLVARLKAGGFLLLDVQFVTAHLASLGAIDISRADYHLQLARALAVQGDFFKLDEKMT
ncbi:MAG: leucyl/phenylalanyl-tRNA--protein transferase [Alphaproteobacteria bacterium]|nr:leucyl/phenylalanyl-tRNA--protein transferase [Alphaproteobacteria bacterium]